MRRARTPAEHFAESTVPEPNSGCLLWLGAVNEHGYGKVRVGRVQYRAHRLAYETFIGPIPAGMQLDHLCRVRSCVNVRHLEIVDNRTNVLRGIGFAAVNATKTGCDQGHQFDTFRKDSRRCSICDKRQRDAYYAANIEECRASARVRARVRYARIKGSALPVPKKARKA